MKKGCGCLGWFIIICFFCSIFADDEDTITTDNAQEQVQNLAVDETNEIIDSNETGGSNVSELDILGDAIEVLIIATLTDEHYVLLLGILQESINNKIITDGELLPLTMQVTEMKISNIAASHLISTYMNDNLTRNYLLNFIKKYCIFSDYKDMSELAIAGEKYIGIDGDDYDKDRPIGITITTTWLDMQVYESVKKYFSLGHFDEITQEHLDSIQSVIISGDRVIVSQDFYSNPYEMFEIEPVAPSGDDYCYIDLKKFNNLRSLAIQNINSSYLNVVIPSLENLEVLGFAYIGLRDIAFKPLDNVKTLYLQENNLENIDGVTNIESLEVLVAYNNSITTVPDLSRLTNLKEINLTENKITDISNLITAPNLFAVGLQYNQITDVSVIPQMPNLTELYIQGNQIQDVSPIVDILHRLPHYNY